jgi:hypothetical protein
MPDANELIVRKLFHADASGRAVYGVGLRRFACWDCGLESRRGHGCLSLVNVVCCSGRGLCHGPIPPLQESYPVCVCVTECDQVQQ